MVFGLKMGEHNNVSSLEAFLESRGVPVEIINYFHDEKIDEAVLASMSEETLKMHIPKYGDRVAIRTFSKRILSNHKKTSLIEKLRSKMYDNEGATKKNSQKSKVARRTTRLVEIGWLCMNSNDGSFRQVRTKAGGGTRKVPISRNAKCEEVIEKAKDLFFPNGISSKGRLENFEIELLDYKSHKLDLKMTVQHIYDISALSSLRFYLATTYKEGIPYIESEEQFIPATVTSNSLPESSQPHGFLGCNGSEEQNITATITNFPEISHHTFLGQTQPTTEYSSPLASYLVDFGDGENDMIYEAGDYDSLPSNGVEVLIQERVPLNKVILHRGNVFQELLECIKTHICDFKTLTVEMILPNGSKEMGEDLGGVLRDAITEFWETFYAKCTLGTNLKVPVLRHDFQKEEWIAIGKICSEGYLSLEYFPIKIAPVFIEYCFDQEVETDAVMNNFLEYIPESEAKLLKVALSNFDEADYDELLEFCSTYDAKWIPQKNNLEKLIKQIAMEELIQKPSFVKDCFSSAFKSLTGLIDLKTLYHKLEPSSKNIIALFDLNDILLEGEKLQIYNFLKKFIKTGDEKVRSAFLRYCTGSNLATSKRIRIEFIDTDGYTRIPIAHTCSELLQIPTTYKDFVSFREEFSNLLISDIWVMDIV